MVPGWQGSVNLRECSPWFLNADPPDFSAKELERSSFFASIRNKWWDGLVQCATVQICNKSRKFANIEFFSPRVSRTHRQEAQQHRKPAFLTGFAISDRFWEAPGIFERRLPCLMMTASRLGTPNPDWLLISHKSTLCAFFPVVAPCVVFSLSQSSSYFLIFVFLILSLFSELIFSFLVFKLEWLSNHPLKVRRALLLRLLIQLLDFLAK